MLRQGLGAGGSRVRGNSSRQRTSVGMARDCSHNARDCARNVCDYAHGVIATIHYVVHCLRSLFMDNVKKKKRGVGGGWGVDPSDLGRHSSA